MSTTVPIPAARTASSGAAEEAREPHPLMAALRWATSRYRSEAPGILRLLLGWAACWIVLELLVIGSHRGPGGPLWIALHLAYFWGTAYWEAAILRRALAATGAAHRTEPASFFDHRSALRFFLLKMVLVPAFLVGLALLIVPGLWAMARWGPAFFLIAEGERLGAALGRSDRATCGKRARAMGTALFLIAFNLLGAALAGLGLLITLPMSALMCAWSLRETFRSPQAGVVSSRDSLGSTPSP